MLKRDFLKAILAGGAALVPHAGQPGAAMSAASEWPTPDHPRMYRGYAYHWTGWKGGIDNAWLCGQWLAWPLRGFGHVDVPDRELYLYLNVPGFVGGVYHPGAVFNITNRGRYVDYTTPVGQSDAWLDEGETYIRQLIDVFAGQTALKGWAPLYNFPVAPGEIARSVEFALTPVEYSYGFTGFRPA